MPESTQRWAYVKSQLQDFGLICERVDGVDVSTLSQSEIDKYYSYSKNKKEYTRPLSKGEIGCYIAKTKRQYYIYYVLNHAFLTILCLVDESMRSMLLYMV